MHEFKLSIIVSVYNVEKYIQACINSITNQWTDSCELILVDDGSTDSSSQICDNNASSSIKVIHKNNGGPSSARNEGLKLAKGRYVAFVDSDDLLAEGCIPMILDWIDSEDSDLCFMQAIKFYPDGHEESIGDNISGECVNHRPAEEVMRYLASRHKYSGSACTKIFKKDFLENNSIMFPRDRRLSEDLGFVMDCLLKANSFSALDFPYYKYRQNRVGSRTSVASIQSVQGLLLFENESIEKLMNGRKPRSGKCLSAMSFVAYEYMILLYNYAGLLKENRKNLQKDVEQLKWVLNYGTTLKIHIVNILSKVIGVNKTANVLRWAYNHRNVK